MILLPPTPLRFYQLPHPPKSTFSFSHQKENKQETKKHSKQKPPNEPEQYKTDRQTERKLQRKAQETHTTLKTHTCVHACESACVTACGAQRTTCVVAFLLPISTSLFCDFPYVPYVNRYEDMKITLLGGYSQWTIGPKLLRVFMRNFFFLRCPVQALLRVEYQL